MDWKRTDTDFAPEGVKIMTKLDDEDGLQRVEPLVRKGSRWWTPGGNPVLHTPTHWAP